jgi:hypothetical protein
MPNQVHLLLESGKKPLDKFSFKTFNRCALFQSFKRRDDSVDQFSEFMGA